MTEDAVSTQWPETRAGTGAASTQNPERRRARRWQLSLVSLFIVTVLSFQIAANVLRTDLMWPFLDYPMYSYSRQEGQRLVVEYTVYGTTPDGTEVKITPADLGMGWFLFRLTFLADIFRDDLSKVAVYLDDYRKRHGKTFTALRIEDRALIVTRDKIDLAPPPEVVKEVVLMPPGS